MSFLDSIKELISKFLNPGVTPVSKIETKKEPSFSMNIVSPCDGKVVDRANIPEPGFASGVMGEGLGILPDNGAFKVFMPGCLELIHEPSRHAYIMKDPKSEVNVMLHIGIDTVKIDASKGAFTTTRSQGENFSGNGSEDLCTVNLETVKEEGKDTTAVLLVMQDDAMNGKKVVIHKKGGEKVKAGDLLMSVVSV